MKYSKILTMFTGVGYFLTGFTFAVDKKIFDNTNILEYFSSFSNILVEIKIEPANGSSGAIEIKEDFSGREIPNSTRDLYRHFPKLKEMIAMSFPPDYYLKVSETLSESGRKEKITSFIGVYARDLLKE